ncbi:polyhydroxyalkanoic acid system protein [Phenylobacterium hankyongense]|uniref:Polyhydroxyalkanoic acid system protein n=1 Tax=Phenylobacterium hankyongense TaxID=1813876 RepID=A0A328B1P3_9CAUL|nr:polyhydroxyalkanoic acid system family protein [Phenylobacterium hankyongense]RAK61103.1 polyhydroxyalkanoic acid system protein [Phenylobacterium hankyongense]
MTRAITVTIPHQLGRAEARRRIDEGFGSFTQHMGGAAGMLSKTWEGDRLSFALNAMGQGISGYADVDDTTVKLDLLLPNLLGMIADKLKGRLKKEGQLLLEKK